MNELNKTEVQQKQQSNNVTDFLDNQRKKRKNYTVIAGSAALPPDTINTMEVYIKRLMPGIITSKPTNLLDLAKLATKQIKMIIIDDEFAQIDEIMKALKIIKEKKANMDIPVLFLTRNVDNLISAYHKELLLYQETDDYVNYRKNSIDRVLSKIKANLSDEFGRKSRRFTINLPISYYQLRYNRVEKGNLIDLSVHGAQIECLSDHLFEMREQIRLSLPIYNYLKPTMGDYLHLTAIVRRVFISGSRAGISFENLSDSKRDALCEYLINYVNSYSKFKPAKKK